MAGGGWVDRAFERSLRVLPRWFRDRYGDEVVETFRDGRAEAFRAGLGQGTLFTVRAFAMLPIERWRLRRSRCGVGGFGGFGADGGPGAEGAGPWPWPLARWGAASVQAARSLRRAPGWTAACLLLLTLGIGGTTAVFSVIHAVLIRELPYEEPDRLVSLWTVNQTQGMPDGSSWENATDWVARGASLEDAALVMRPEFTSATLAGFGEPERVHVGWVSSNFFEMLGVEPVQGRLFAPGDEDGDAVVVIDEALWAARFGRDPGVVGRTLEMDGATYRITGVVPRELALPRRETSVWRLHDVRTPADRDWRGFDAYWVLGRLRPGVSIEGARADLKGVAAELAEEFPLTNGNRSVSVKSLHDEIVGDTLPLLLWTLLGSMVLVLLIGATNVAQLMISRGVARRRELAVRASLGASRGAIRRQLVAESALLAVLAAAAGILAARVGLDALLAVLPPDVPLTDRVRLDPSVLSLALGVSCLLGPTVGIVPALATSRIDLGEALRGGGRASTRRDRRARSFLVVTEVAMAVVLLGGAGLLVRSALELGRVDPGFDARRALVARVDFGPVAEGEDHAPLHGALVDELGGAPGVLGAGTIGQLFIRRFPDQTITLLGEEPRPSGEPSPRLTTDQVYPGFFEAAGIPLLRGRSFTVADIGDPNRPDQVVVNEAWVDTFSPDRDPIGRRFRWGDQVEGDALTVVGVVADMRRSSLEEASYPQMFVAGAGPSAYVVLSTRDDPARLASAVREAVHRLDPAAAVSEVAVAWDLYQDGLASRRFQTFALGSFALLATLLSAFGLFAILHDAVAARRREIGVRMALGARPGGLRGMVVGQGLTLVGGGLATGLVALVLLSGVTARFVYGVGSVDPVTLVAVGALITFVTVAASALPALSATRVSPIEVLADE